MNSAEWQPHALMLKIYDATILGLSLVFSSLALHKNLESLLIALGGSFSGAVVLAYFRRDNRKGEQMFKSFCAAISGLVIGSTIQEYFGPDNTRFSLGIYFMSGLLSLVILRALFNATERNAAEACKHFLQRLLGLHLEHELERGRRRLSDEGRLVTFDRTKEPNKEGQENNELG